MAGVGTLYLHVPFCAQKCAYCDFASWQTPAADCLMADYTRSLEGQVRAARELGLLEACSTIYIGGGTPSYLGAATLASLVACVRDACPEIVELTCEANPDSLDDRVLSAMRDAGATRVSMGVQSLSDDELRSLGRIHDAARARDRVRAAKAAGLNVSVDLMCAIPRQTASSWEATLREIVGLDLQHVSVYPLMIEEGTPLGERYADAEPAWNDEDVQADRMEAADKILSAAGLARYEVASYAAPGRACRHNQAYWSGIPYLGLGTGASGMLDAAGYEVLRTACPQLPAMRAGEARTRLRVTSGRRDVARDGSLGSLSFEAEYLTEEQAIAEDLMLGMRMSRGVGEGLIRRARDAFGSSFDEATDRLLERGLVCVADGRISPTHDGWLLGNELFGELWSLADARTREVRC